MSDIVNYELYDSLSSYLRYRRDCFNNYIQYVPNDSFDKLINARYSKVSRIKKRLLYLLTHRSYVYFLTFTFDDDFITRCDRTKKDLIKSSLNTFDSDILIILNKDYGKKTDREHYHAIVGSNNCGDLLTHIRLRYPYRVGIEKVRKDCKSVKKLSKYINKLTNHCIKDSTKNSRLYFNFKGYDNLDPIFYFLDRKLYLIQGHTLPC